LPDQTSVTHDAADASRGGTDGGFVVRSRSGSWRLVLALVAIVIALLVLGRWALVSLVYDAMEALRANDLPEHLPADSGTLEPRTFELAGGSYEIMLPKGVTVKLPDSRFDYVEVRFPHTRKIRLFTLAPASSGEKTYDRSETLGNGAVLRYSLDEATGSGSGEPEQELRGQLEIGGRVLSVLCHDQAMTPSPYWVCVPYLHHIRIDQ
jgi:hypothetical protein